MKDRAWDIVMPIGALAVMVMIAAFLSSLWAMPCNAVEQLDITTPIEGQSVTTYKVAQLTISTTPPVIDWTVVDNTGKTISGTYNGATATTLLNQLNTGNFKVTSLQKQIILRLQVDGYLPSGTITGTPQ